MLGAGSPCLGFSAPPTFYRLNQQIHRKVVAHPVHDLRCDRGTVEPLRRDSQRDPGWLWGVVFGEDARGSHPSMTFETNLQGFSTVTMHLAESNDCLKQFCLIAWWTKKAMNQGHLYLYRL